MNDLGTLPVYEYRPLESPRTIRVLFLSRGNDHEPLRGQLKHINLDNAPPYLAMSYVWGNPLKEHDFGIGDQRISITASLNNVLRDMRALRNATPGPHPIILWVDAICIDQTNVVELGHQVSLMGDIYRKAAGVFTYIGPEGEHCREALQLAVRLSDFDHQRGGGTWRDYETFAERNFAKHGFPPSDDPAWDALIQLMNRAWSSRVWIVQESLLNPKLKMLCGRIFVPWGLLGSIAHLALNQRIPRLTSMNCGRGLDLLQNQADLRLFAESETYAHPKTFYHLLRMCHPFLSTNPLDKVYALLGIAPDRQELGIVPDYTKPVAQLYTEVAESLMRTYSNLDLFCSVHTEKSIQLPTWVPDWSAHDFQYELFINNPFIMKYGLNRASADIPAYSQISEDRTQLHLQGAIIDRISHVDGDERPIGSYVSPFLLNQLDRLATLKMYTCLTGEIEDWRRLLRNLVDVLHDTDPLNSFLEAGLRLDALLSEQEMQMSIDAPKMQHLKILTAAFHHTVAKRTFFTTEEGYIGLGPKTTRAGDLTCIFLGGPFPYVIRGSGDNFELIGESYVHGLMKGGALALEELSLKTITLI